MEKEEKNSIVSFLIWLCITVFYCYQCVLRSLPNIIRQDVMSNFDIGATEFGSFSGIYYIGYIVLHIPGYKLEDFNLSKFKTDLRNWMAKIL